MTIRFNLRPPGRPEYITVCIFEDQQKMFAYHRRFSKRAEHPMISQDYVGLFLCYHRFRGPNLDILVNDIGQVLLHHPHVTPDIIAHELGHAAMHYERVVHHNRAARFGEYIGRNEERFLATQQYLIEAFYERVTLRGRRKK